ncbi:MAG: DUF1127 domain-containing protein [Hyphomicrobiaceae bacterium]|nr:MAG: DUF1127 domain-containing protein [Hyphomicrobiaceae bacterium]
MATSIHTLTPADAIAGNDHGPAGFLDRFFQRFIEARERQARSIVRQHLSALSDARLAELGYSAAEIKEIKAHTYGPVSVWG